MLVIPHISDTTGSDGIYNLFRIETAIQKDLTRSDFFPTKYDGAALNFSVKQPIQDVSLDIYNLSGTKIANVLRGNLGQGNYSLAPFSYCAINLSAQLYIVRLKIGNEVSSHRAQNIWQRTHSSLSYTPLSVQALAKQSLVSDTVIYVKDGQVITTTGISKYIDTLKDLFIIQRDIFGNLLSKPQSFSEIRAVISGNTAFDSTRKAAGLWYNEPNQSFSGFVYFVYSVQVQNYSVLVDVYNKGGALIGRSEKVNFPSTAGNINIPAFNPNNAVPVIEAGIDAFVSINDTIRLHPVAIDSFGGAIKKWEWSINGGAFVQTLTGDTAFIAPADSNPFYKCIVKVTDNEGNFAFDSMNIVIFKDTPKANAGKDTTVVHIANDTVRLHGSATQQFGIIKKWEWDFGGKGVFVRVSRADTNIIFPNNGGLPYLCILRVTDDDGNLSSPDTMQVGFSPDCILE